MIWKRLFKGFRGRDESRYGVLKDDLLYFPTIRGDKDQLLDGIYAIVIRSRDHRSETWTSRIHELRQGQAQALAGWTRVLLEATKSLKTNKNTVLTCALRAERTAFLKDDPIVQLGRALGQDKNWDFRPDILNKRAHRSLSKLRMADHERRREVKSVYTCDKLESVKTFVVLDDYCSGGATLAEVARSIRTSNRYAKVLGLVLGRTRSSPKSINDHLSEQLCSKWFPP